MLDSGARYVYEVYRLKSVSKAAESLFMSQPALSAAIRRVEEEIGAPIFNRKKLPFTLTPEGKVYVEAVEQMLGLEKRTSEHIADLRQTKQGLLRLGISTYLSYAVIPLVLKEFHERYPQVEVSITAVATTDLIHALETDTVDMVFMPTESVPSPYESVSLLNARLTVVLRRDTPEAERLKPYTVSYQELLSRSYDKSRMLSNMSMLNGIEFVYSPPKTSFYKKRRLLFGGSESESYVISNATNALFNYNLMRAGVGAFLTNDLNLATLPRYDDLVYLVLDGNDTEQDFAFVYPRDKQSTVCRAFVEIARSQFSVNDLPLRLQELQ